MSLELPPSSTALGPVALQPPAGVALICLLGFIGGIGGYVIALQVQHYRLMGTWVPPVMALLSVLELAAYINVWQMKRWAVKMHMALFVAAVPFSLWIGGGQYWAVLAFSITLNIFFIGYLLRVVR